MIAMLLRIPDSNLCLTREAADYFSLDPSIIAEDVRSRLEAGRMPMPETDREENVWEGLSRITHTERAFQRQWAEDDRRRADQEWDRFVRQAIYENERVTRQQRQQAIDVRTKREAAEAARERQLFLKAQAAADIKLAAERQRIALEREKEEARERAAWPKRVALWHEALRPLENIEITFIQRGRMLLSTKDTLRRFYFWSNAKDKKAMLRDAKEALLARFMLG